MKPKSENSRAPASGFSLFGACTVMENACQSLLIPEVLVTWQELRTSQQFWSQFQWAVNGSGRGYNPHFGTIGSLFHLVIRLVWKGSQFQEGAVHCCQDTLEALHVLPDDPGAHASFRESGQVCQDCTGRCFQGCWMLPQDHLRVTLTMNKAPGTGQEFRTPLRRETTIGPEEG